METLTYKDSWVKFTDCIEGMKELPDKSIDLCLTDPPYNIKYKGKSSSPKIMYNDNLTEDEYTTFCRTWMEEVLRICKLVVFTPGNNNYWIYCQLFGKPKTQFIHYKRNAQGSTYLSHFQRFEIILVYGEYWDWKFGKKPFIFDVMEFNVISGFMINKNNTTIHPCPKTLRLWKHLIDGLQPTSVLDPFMGSGTTLEACIQLGIPCYGFELMEEYRGDMEKRIERSKYHKKEQSLDNFI